MFMKRRCGAPHNAHSISNRCYFDKLSRIFILLLFLSHLFGVQAAARSPEEPPFPDLVLIPDDSNTPVLVNAFTVDATLLEAEAGARWEIITRIRLHNPSPTEPATIRLRLTLTPDMPLPADLRMTVGRDENEAQPFTAPTYEHILQPDARVWLTFVYTTPLRPHPWTRFHYGIHRLQAWPKVVGSVRVSVHLPSQLPREAFLHISPKTTAYNGRLVEWQWEERTPPVPVEVLLVRPTVWKAIAEWRAQGARGDLIAQARLARLLTDMVTANAAPPEVVDAFYPEALGLWTALAERRPDDPQPWEEMAALYELQAKRGDADAYTALALAALEEAWARGGRSEVARAHLAEIMRDQMRRLITAARWQEALITVQRLGDVLGPGSEQEVMELRREVALAWAQAQAAEGNREGMLEAIALGWGENVLGYFVPRYPSLRYLTVEVTTEERARTVVITAALAPGARPAPRETWESFVRALRAAVLSGQVEVEQKGNLVRAVVRVPFADPQELRAALARLAGVVPDQPEWALVRAALSPLHLERRQRLTLWSKETHWQEEVDLTPAQRDIDEAVRGLRTAVVAPVPSDFPDVLVPLLRQQREEDLLAWQDLRDKMAAVYILRWDDPPGPPLHRRWHLAPGEHVVMQARRVQPAMPRLAVLGGALVFAWTVLSLVLWRVLGRE